MYKYKYKYVCNRKSTGSLLTCKLMLSQLTGPCLFNSFNDGKISLLFCNSTTEPALLFMHNHNYLFEILKKNK